LPLDFTFYRKLAFDSAPNGSPELCSFKSVTLLRNLVHSNQSIEIYGKGSNPTAPCSKNLIMPMLQLILNLISQFYGALDIFSGNSLEKLCKS
jgi:hypothetical protein